MPDTPHESSSRQTIGSVAPCTVPLSCPATRATLNRSVTIRIRCVLIPGGKVAPEDGLDGLPSVSTSVELTVPANPLEANGLLACRATTVRPRRAARSEIVAFGLAPASSPSSGPAQRVDISVPPAWSRAIVSVPPRIVAEGPPPDKGCASAHTLADCPGTRALDLGHRHVPAVSAEAGGEGEEGQVADTAVPPVGLDAQVARSGAKYDRPRIAAQPGGGAAGGDVAVERDRELARDVDRDIGLRQKLGATRDAERVQN